MDAPSSSTTSSPVTDALLATLTDEADVIERLATCVERQLDALRTGETDHFKSAGIETSEVVSTLDQTGRTRSRQHALLARSLGVDERLSLTELAEHLPAPEADRLREARERVRAVAVTADGRCDALAFSLHYAAELGRETLAAWRGLGAERPAHVYTAAGGTTPAASGRSFLNQTG